ncbi:predicted protein [Plenodomus lingam JN3]|uniref:Predicted protein n=1 Tax=Leptosphaeria maculans (strain JN3 / isolate v23.1.3 / race Av1-4-5-6-7-8) TaxID=985895 RepID=E4ZHQ3_LEPMJ|nr:predicted protein [Plenodomus lingam JN3]CBX90886.1 predicted protein [Plenodomus lingam JN3]
MTIFPREPQSMQPAVTTRLAPTSLQLSNQQQPPVPSRSPPKPETSQQQQPPVHRPLAPATRHYPMSQHLPRRPKSRSLRAPPAPPRDPEHLVRLATVFQQDKDLWRTQSVLVNKYVTLYQNFCPTWFLDVLLPCLQRPFSLLLIALAVSDGGWELSMGKYHQEAKPIQESHVTEVFMTQQRWCDPNPKQ